MLVEIYKASLDFLGKLAVPGAILILALSFLEDLSKTFDGLRLSKLETPLGSAQFEEIIEELASTEPNSAAETKVIRKIEAQEELVRAEIEGGLRNQIPVAGISLPASSAIRAPQPDSPWTVALGTSWVKPNDLFGRTYFLNVENEFYLWPLRLDANTKQAIFTISHPVKPGAKGQTIAENIWIDEGDSYQFKYKNRTYRINLLSIKRPAIPSNAAYISVDVK